MSRNRGLLTNCFAVSVVSVLSSLFSLKTDLTGNFDFLSSSLTSSLLTDVGMFLIISDISFWFFNLCGVSFYNVTQRKTKNEQLYC